MWLQRLFSAITLSALAVGYYFAISPVAAAMRFFGRDTLLLRAAADSLSGWRSHESGSVDMTRPF